MSYDLFVYDKDAAPNDKADFDAWFSSEVEAEGPMDAWINPATTSPGLRKWFEFMSAEFPALNGPASPLDIEERGEEAGDYNFRPQSIYVSFAWSRSTRAAELGTKFAEQCDVGLFDPQGGETTLPIALYSLSTDSEKQGWLQKLSRLFGGKRG